MASSEVALPMSSGSRTFNMRCHCGTVNYTCTIPNSAFPIRGIFCHCSDCRYASGQLFGDFVPLYSAGTPIPKPDLSRLTSYKISAQSVRFFCPTCGASPYLFDGEECEFAEGLMDDVHGVLNRHHLFVGPTLDGGGVAWIPKVISGMEVKRYLGHKRGGEVDDELLRRMMKVMSPASRMSRLPAKCLCESVKFYITRPAQEGATGAQAKGLFDACLCMCTSCRTCSGNAINAWASVPAANIFQGDERPFDLDNPALAHYESSKGVHRHFCKTCGAIVFFRKDDRDPQVWDIAVGLFRDITVRVEGWLEWQKTIDFTEDASDKDLAKALRWEG